MPLYTLGLGQFIFTSKDRTRTGLNSWTVSKVVRKSQSQFSCTMPVLALVASPWSGVTRSLGIHRQKNLKSGQRRFKASELDLRNSDVGFLKQACLSCELDAKQRECLDVWLHSGSWPSEHQEVVGAVLLQKPRALQQLGNITNRESFLLWHAWGSPAPHLANPQWLLFDVLASTCFQQPLDHRAHVGQLKLAEQRSSWTMCLREEALQQLNDSLCSDGRALRDVLQGWGVESSRELTVFTSLAPVVFLTVRGKWPVLADMVRCTEQQVRRPRGALFSVARVIAVQYRER